MLLQAKQDQRAARKLMRKLLKRQGMVPDEWVTDKNPAYGAALRNLKSGRGTPSTARPYLFCVRSKKSFIPEMAASVSEMAKM